MFDNDRYKVQAYFSDPKASLEVKTGDIGNILTNACQTKQKKHGGFEWPRQKLSQPNSTSTWVGAWLNNG